MAATFLHISLKRVEQVLGHDANEQKDKQDYNITSWANTWRNNAVQN